MTLPTELFGPFDVKTGDLLQIEPARAVELFRQLLVIEARKTGRPSTSVNVPAAITVADGGIDAEVEFLDGASLPAGLISAGITRYQIKTGAFSLSTQGNVRSLLLKPKHAATTKPKREHLQQRVLSCFEKGGAFVVVLFGSDLVGTDDEYGKNQLVEFMTRIDPAFSSVNVRIIRANQLCSAIKTLAPGIALRLNRLGGNDDALLNDIEFLGESCDLQVEAYCSTAALDRATTELTRIADTLGNFRHVRVLGDAGAGKTHLIFRALSASSLTGCVLYCSDPEELDGSAPLKALVEMSKGTTIVLVADECDLETAGVLANRFKRRATNMLLITAYNETEPSSAHLAVDVIDVAPLAQPAVSEIFKEYGVPAEIADWLANLCEGSPRAAHRLGSYIAANPEQQHTQHLAHLDGFWDLFVCSPDKPQSQAGQERLAVMRTLALFRQLGWDTSDGSDTQATVLRVLQMLDVSFSALKLTSAVDSLRRKRALQGPRTLFISPKLLHVAMWKGWCETYGKLVDIVELRESLADRMLDHFDAMLVYARESKVASNVVEGLLGEGGPFATLAGFSAPGAPNLFFAVAQANPKAALRRLKSALEAEATESRVAFSGDGRRAVIRGLEHLAVSTETFFDAATCLLLLAEAENENWSNNATGVFVSMFGLGYGKVAASELAPSEKIPYLRAMLNAPLAQRRLLAIQALRESLSPFISRSDIGDMSGLTRLPDRWMPTTYEQLYEAYWAHVGLLNEGIEFLPPNEADEAAQAILTHIRSLILIPTLAPKLISILRRISEMSNLREDVVASIVAILHYEGKALPADIAAALETLKSDLTETSFACRLRRYAGMRLLEDNFGTDGTYTDEPAAELVALASDVRATPSLLMPELVWLVTDAAKNGFQFGNLLGALDDDLELWPIIIGAWVAAGNERSEFFVGGYLSALHVTNIGLWEFLISELFDIAELRSSLVQVVWRSGMSDTVARELLLLARSGVVEPTAFRFFVYGGVVNQMPIDVIVGVVDLLLAMAESFASDCALDILESRLRGVPQDMKTLSVFLERVLDAPNFIEGGSAKTSSSNMTDYRWNEGANLLLRFAPVRAARIAIRCIEHFGSSGSVTSGYLPESLKFLVNTAGEQPVAVWGAIGRRLKGKLNTGSWRLLQWLRGSNSSLPSAGRRGKGGLEAIPSDLILHWIDGNVDERAWLLAEYCPPQVSFPSEPPSFARLLLERYGSAKRVRESLHANSFTGSWSGSPSQHFRGKLNQVEAQLKVETHLDVRTWLLEQRARLEVSVANEVAREELD